ncbi:MAG TPA: dihydrolipoamide acetyltransferase family protein [Polyangiaceae bacterium]|nr:dihydrolipoamide acetyltransferase family protein [Polyangiaceae bacterium]
MTRFEFKLPDIGEGVTEGEIVSWLIAPGQTIAEDEPMVEVMTDKATVTIAAPKAGRIVETRGAVGEVVKVHSVLVVFDLDEASRASGARRESSAPGDTAKGTAAENGSGKHKGESVATAVGDLREELPGMKLTKAKGSAFWNEKPLATPATRKLARDLGLDLRRVPPSGSHGRVTSDDIRSAGRGPDPEPAHEVHMAPVAPVVSRPLRTAAETPSLEERTPLKGLRKRIFENMARSKREAAHFTFVEECDVTALKALRERLKPAAKSQGVELSYLPFIIKALVAALRRHPSLNATFDEAAGEIVTRRYYNVGIATATESGLVVPVIKNADDRSLLELAREISRLSEAARAGLVQLADLQGGTFTVTSLGQKSGLFATPIINFPEVAILGVHQMKRKPVVRGDQIVIGDTMLVSLSFGHRLIDGHVGAAFAYELIELLEKPETIFLDLV